MKYITIYTFCVWKVAILFSSETTDDDKLVTLFHSSLILELDVGSLLLDLPASGVSLSDPSSHC